MKLKTKIRRRNNYFVRSLLLCGEQLLRDLPKSFFRDFHCFESRRLFTWVNHRGGDLTVANEKKNAAH